MPEQWANLIDAPHFWRKAPFILLLACLLIFGCFPSLLTDKIQASVKANVLTNFSTPTSFGVRRQSEAATELFLPNAD